MTDRSTRPLSVWRPTNLDRFMLGAAHYPEHVDSSFWERDAERMAAAGFNTARIGEFAWHIFEPREGVFDFSLFDAAIAVLGRHGIKTILCTPTAAPPRWLTLAYPEVLRVDSNGRTMSHGSRQHADTASSVFRALSRRITAAMASHYRDHPDVVGWQTDNELNTTMSESYSAATLTEFRLWARVTYKTVDRLNFAWGGDFWATAYDSFEAVELPHVYAPASLSPGHVQDYHRFLAFATARFQHDQVTILRAANPEWFIFHNLGTLRDIDFRGQFSTDLDFIGFDNYPFLYDEMQRMGDHATVQAFVLDTFRGYTGNFIVPEHQSGYGSQPGFATLTPEPGEMRRMAMSSVAHGADGILFFRWRPAHFGAEIYWMGILDHDDVPRARYEEARRFAQDITRIEKKILGTHVRMDVGIAGSDYDNQEAHKTYAMGLPSPQDDALHLHRYCQQRAIACGFIHLDDDLSRLKLLYVPHWVIWDEAWTRKLEAFAAAGGTVVLSARTATRDRNNHVLHETAPGAGLGALSGVSVIDSGRLAAPGALGLLDPAERWKIQRPSQSAVSGTRERRLRIGNHDVAAGHFYEALAVVPGVDVVGTWSNRYAQGQPVITRRAVGDGWVYYLGTYLTDELVPPLVEPMLERAGVVPLIADVPAGLDVTMRETPGRRLLFVQNVSGTAVSVPGVPAGQDLVGPASGSSAWTLELEPYGCAIVELSE